MAEVTYGKCLECGKPISPVDDYCADCQRRHHGEGEPNPFAALDRSPTGKQPGIGLPHRP